QGLVFAEAEFHRATTSIRTGPTRSQSFTPLPDSDPAIRIVGGHVDSRGSGSRMHPPSQRRQAAPNDHPAPKPTITRFRHLVSTHMVNRPAALAPQRPEWSWPPS